MELWQRGLLIGCGVSFIGLWILAWLVGRMLRRLPNDIQEFTNQLTEGVKAIMDTPNSNSDNESSS